MSDQLKKALSALLAIIEDSEGVYGYHPDGNLEPWDGFLDEILNAKGALKQCDWQPKETNPIDESSKEFGGDD